MHPLPPPVSPEYWNPDSSMATGSGSFISIFDRYTATISMEYLMSLIHGGLKYSAGTV